MSLELYHEDIALNVDSNLTKKVGKMKKLSLRYEILLMKAMHKLLALIERRGCSQAEGDLSLREAPIDNLFMKNCDLLFVNLASRDSNLSQRLKSTY